MSKFTDKLSTNLMLGLGEYAKNKSITQRNQIGKRVGNILRLLSKKRQNITIDNIKKAFPELSQNKITSIMKGSYHNLGITLVELLCMKYMSEEDLRTYVKYENIELIKEVHSRGKGMILLSGHFGNWELVAYTVGMFSGIPTTAIVKPQKNKYADKILNEYRTNETNTIVNMHKSARIVVQTLRSGMPVCILADQSATRDKDIYVDFFGRPAATYEAPAALALKFGAPIIIGFSVRQEDCTYKVQLREIKTDDLDDSKESIKILTERHVMELENEIRKYPYLWAWQHRRWKHTNNG